MKDILGTALLDYYHGNSAEDIITETDISEEEQISLPYLFRSYSEMPSLEGLTDGENIPSSPKHSSFQQIDHDSNALRSLQYLRKVRLVSILFFDPVHY